MHLKLVLEEEKVQEHLEEAAKALQEAWSMLQKGDDKVGLGGSLTHQPTSFLLPPSPPPPTVSSRHGAEAARLGQGPTQAVL